MKLHKSKEGGELERIQAIAATDALVKALVQARELLSSCAIDAHIFSIPTLTEEMDGENPPTEPVSTHTGKPAIHTAITALCRTKYHDWQHPKSTLRRPGMLIVDQDLSTYIAHINQLKAELRAAMKAFGHTAWREWRQAIPGWQRLNRLQAYRDWHWIEEPVRRIGFTWAGHTTGTEYLRIAELIARLSNQRKHGGHDRIDNELDMLASYNKNEVIAISRPIAPTPMVNIAFADGRRRAIKTALPLLTHQPKPKISPLKNYTEKDNRKKRTDVTTEANALIARWHAFRFLPPFRFHLRVNPVPARLKYINKAIEIKSARQENSAILKPISKQAFIAMTAAAIDARGPASDGYTLDANGDVILVAANRAHVFFDAGINGVWRIPIGDLKIAANKTDLAC